MDVSDIDTPVQLSSPIDLDPNCNWATTTLGMEEAQPNQVVASFEEAVEQGESSKKRTRGKPRNVERRGERERER